MTQFDIYHVLSDEDFLLCLDPKNLTIMISFHMTEESENIFMTEAPETGCEARVMST